MRVLLTGAFGNIGRETLRELLHAGHEVRCLALAAPRAQHAAAELAGRAEIVWGDFFDGKMIQVNAKLELRPSPHLFVALEYEQSDPRLPEGNFTQRLGRVRINLAFTPQISWSNIGQYDNVSSTIGVKSIFRWEVEPGNDIYFVLQLDSDVDGSTIRPPSFLQLAGKIVWTFRF